jgi:hypothetical protein
MATLGVGGYINYNESGIRWAESNSYTRGIYEIPVTYERNVSLMGFGGIGYAVDITNKLNLELGIQAGFSFFRYQENWKSLPEQIKPQFWFIDTIQEFTYDEIRYRSITRYAWLGPTLNLNYHLTKKIKLGLNGTVGARYTYVERSGGGISYSIKGNYSPYVNGVFDPYNNVVNNISKSGTYLDFAPPKKPLENRIDLLGMSSLTFILTVLIN